MSYEQRKGLEAMSREKGIVERMETLERMAALDDLAMSST